MSEQTPFPESSSHDETPHTHDEFASDVALRRQLKLFKALAGIAVAALLAGGGYIAYQRHLGQPVSILIDGKPIVTVQNQQTANSVLAASERKAAGFDVGPKDVIRLQKVQFVHVSGSEPIDSPETAQDKLAGRLKLHVYAYAISVNKHVTVALPTEKDADKTLDLIKEHFAQEPPDSKVVGEPEFSEHVVVSRKAVDPARIKSSPEDAAAFSWTPPPAKEYTVKPHETGYAIARKNKVSFSDFLKANAGRNLNKLMPGDTVIIQKNPLPLTVLVRKQLQANEKIIPNAPEDQAGLRAVTYLVTYANGAEIRREVQNMMTIKKPRTRTEL
ncbi:MAG: LysM peptidoglycan-binding domain-containing protein [Capsulimonas sp.]|uniref:LysM peptidoglycan-binding domain-containing protein n=1 Tax=Capsulimonas sp. TaxID=2494211 RepID=UPI003265FB75